MTYVVYPVVVRHSPGRWAKTEGLWGKKRLKKGDSVFALDRADSGSTSHNSGLAKVTLREPSPTRGTLGNIPPGRWAKTDVYDEDKN